MKIQFLWLLLLIFTSCSHLKKESISPCFKNIVENKFDEFKDRIDECKTYKNKDGLTSLMMAISKNNNDIAEYLIEQNIDVNAVDQAGFTALTYAANKNNARLVQVLRKRGARIEIIQNNLTSLMMAVRNSSYELIRVMDPSEVEVNLQAEDGWTALNFAISRQDSDILNLLLKQKACTNYQDKYNQTPLQFAIEIKWTEGISILKNNKSNCHL